MIEGAPILDGLFLGGGAKRPPRLYIDSDPLAFLGLKKLHN